MNESWTSSLLFFLEVGSKYGTNISDNANLESEKFKVF